MPATSSVLEYIPRALPPNSRRICNNTPVQAVPVHVVLFHDDNMASPHVMKPGSRNRCMYRVLILTILMSLCIVCGFMLFVSSVIEKKVMAKLSMQGDFYLSDHRLMKNSNQEGYDVSTTDFNHGYPSIERRSAARRRKRERRKNRGRRSDIPFHCRHSHHNQKSSVHLLIAPGNEEHSFQYSDPAVQGRKFFVWSKQQHHNQSSGFYYKISSQHTDGHDVLGISVRHSGLYDVYSQAIVRGQESVRYRYFCAQEVVLLRQERFKKVLLESYITQHNLGQQFNDLSWHPIDSAYQHGVFYLLKNDQIRVSMTNDCNHVLFDNAHPHAFYFGVSQR